MLSKNCILDVVFLVTVISASVYQVRSIELSVTPNYVQQNTTLTLRCLISERGSDSTIFESGSYGNIQTISNNASGCYSNDGTDCFQSVLCDCNSRTVTLFFQPPSTIDNNFTCEHGSEGKSNTVFRKAIYGPRGIKISPSTKRYVRTINSSLPSVTCSAECNPSCSSYEWKFPDGTTGTSNVLSLSRIEKSHSGMFKCIVTNNLGSEEITFSLDVQYPPENIELSPTTTSYTVKEHDQITISCSANCNPNCMYQWTGPDWSNSEALLRFTSISKSQDGEYLCRANNTHGSLNSNRVTINVNYSPSDVTLSPTKTSYSIMEGSALGPITCAADCKPSCNFKWELPDKTVLSSESLSISSLSKTHHGRFQCKATNEEGTNTAHIDVNVNYGPEKVDLSPASTVQTVREYQSVTISCSADCRPKCSLTWRTLLGVVVTKNNQLTFNSISRKDAGKFYCQALHSFSSMSKVSSTIQIVVQTLPTKVANMSVICTGPNSAAISWIPDLSVVPEQNFTVSFWPITTGLKSEKMYVRNNNHHNIFILHLDELAPSTDYRFQILSENSISKIWSNTIRCKTLVPSSIESTSSSEFIGGIAMISIAIMIIVAVIVIWILRRYNVFKGSTNDYIRCSPCLMFIPFPCLKKNESADPGDPTYINVEPKEQPTDRTGESAYMALDSSKTNDEMNSPYDSLRVKKGQVESESTSSTKGGDRPYANLISAKNGLNPKMENKKQNKKGPEKIALKPPVKKDDKPKPKVAAKPKTKPKKEYNYI